MAEFKPNVAVETDRAEVEVMVIPSAPLTPGRHRFQLVVVDDSGNSSEASTTEVIVRNTQKPSAVLDAPREVELGSSFQFSGKRSSDIAPEKS